MVIPVNTEEHTNQIAPRTESRTDEILADGYGPDVKKRNKSILLSFKFGDLESAFEWVSADAPTIKEAYISRKTGRNFWTSELSGLVEKGVELFEKVN